MLSAHWAVVCKLPSLVRYICRRAWLHPLGRLLAAPSLLKELHELQVETTSRQRAACAELLSCVILQGFHANPKLNLGFMGGSKKFSDQCLYIRKSKIIWVFAEFLKINPPSCLKGSNNVSVTVSRPTSREGNCTYLRIPALKRQKEASHPSATNRRRRLRPKTPPPPPPQNQPSRNSQKRRSRGTRRLSVFGLLEKDRADSVVQGQGGAMFRQARFSHTFRPTATGVLKQSTPLEIGLWSLKLL